MGPIYFSADLSRRQKEIVQMRANTTSRLILTVEAWPAADRDLWQAAARCADVFETSSRAAQWRPATSRLVADCYGRWLTFLATKGWLDEALSADARVSRTRLETYRTELQLAGNRSTTILHRIIGLDRALAVLTPGADREPQKCLMRELLPDCLPRSYRHQLRHSSELLEAGLTTMRSAGKKNREWRSSFRELTAGFQVALMALRPFRLGKARSKLNRNTLNSECMHDESLPTALQR